jgi:adenine phosphoribosyltransferase
MPADSLRQTIRTIPDFPRKGIQFRDITTLLKDPEAIAEANGLLLSHYRTSRIDIVVGIESRGFILGGPLAIGLGAGFVPVRKPGKLPAPVLREEYTLEYGTDVVEIHADAIRKGNRVLLHDDLLATGGTMQAAIRLVERLGGSIVGISFLVELPALCGRDRLHPHDVFSLLTFEGA